MITGFTRQFATVLGAAALLTGLMAPIRAHAQGVDQFPPTDPFQLTGNLYRAKAKIIPVSKIVDGTQVKLKDILLQCPAPGFELSRRLTYSVRAPISSWLCDEFCSNPTLNGTFVATIVVDRREDKEPKRGCFAGTWRILNSLGITVASGTLKGAVRAGTHDALTHEELNECESCGELYHFEGCMEGEAVANTNARINQAACRGHLCATFQGLGLDPDRLLPITPSVPDNGFTMRIEGAVFQPCFKVGFAPIP